MLVFFNCIAWYRFGLVQRKQSPYLPSWKAVTLKWSNNPEEQCLSHLFALEVISVEVPGQARTREHLEAEKKTGRTMWISWEKKFLRLISPNFARTWCATDWWIENAINDDDINSMYRIRACDWNRYNKVIQAWCYVWPFKPDLQLFKVTPLVTYYQLLHC